jgi:hypothetical protein
MNVADGQQISNMFVMYKIVFVFYDVKSEPERKYMHRFYINNRKTIDLYFRSSKFCQWHGQMKH